MSTGIVKSPGVPGVFVADTTALAAYSTSALTNGTIAYVRSLKDSFEYNSSSSATVDTTDFLVVAAATTGRWLRLCIANAEWLQTTTWYIDPATGSNENAGGVSTPLKSWSELSRRVNALCFNTATVTVNIVTSLASTDPIIVNFDVMPGSSPTFGALTIVGTRTTVTTGTLTAVQNLNLASNLPNQITSAAGFTSYVRSYIRFLNGAAFRCSAWIAKDLGGGSARISVATSENGGAAGAQTNPVNGDNYEIYSFTTAPSFQATLASERTLITVRNMQFNGGGGTSASLWSIGAFLRIAGCSVTVTPRLIGPNGIVLNNCLLAGNGVWQAPANGTGIGMLGGLVDGALNASNSVQFQGDWSFSPSPMFQSVALFFVGARTQASSGTGDIGVFDSPAAQTGAVNLIGRSTIGLISIWGSGNAPSSACIRLTVNDQYLSVYGNLVITHSAPYDLSMGNEPVFKQFADIINISDLRDIFGNWFKGPGGGSPSVFAGSMTSSLPAMYNCGENMVPARVVRVSAGAVIKAQADTSAHATGIVGVSTSQNTSGGRVVVVSSGYAVIKFDADPTDGDLCYLSPTNAGQATSTVPASASTNQKLRLGYVLRAFGGGGGLAVVRLHPELIPITSDGVAP